MDETTEPIPQPAVQHVNQAQNAELPTWEQLPQACKHELIMTLAGLLTALLEVNHEPIA